MPYITKYVHVSNGKRIKCQHTECDPKFQKFKYPVIDTGEKPVEKDNELEKSVVSYYAQEDFGLYRVRNRIVGVIIGAVFIIVLIIMCAK